MFAGVIHQAPLLMQMLVYDSLGSRYHVTHIPSSGEPYLRWLTCTFREPFVLMLVQKVYHRRSSLRSRHYNVYHNTDAKLMEGKPLLGTDSDDDSDDPDLPDVCCELAIVEGQTCSIPYELYDLPDLKEILSLDTWNSYLTEEERFSLSAFLPDMDQQTFCLTLNDLFSSANLFFGNPTGTFFTKLKGGFYTPKVAHFRELLQLLQRRKYYHSLCSYHNRMVEFFMSIKRVMDRCDRGIRVDEKLDMWKTMRKGKGNNLLDLNTVPLDRYMFRKEKEMCCHSSANVMSFKSFRGTGSSPSLLAKSFSNTDSNMNPALKMKTYINGSVMNNLNQKMLVKERKEHQGGPKGLLKVIRRVPSVHSEHHMVLSGRQEPASAGAKHLTKFEFPFLPVSSYLRNDFDTNGWPSRSPKIEGNEASITLVPFSGRGTRRKFPDICALDCSAHNIEAVADERSNSLQDAAAVRRYGYGHENIWKFLDIRTEGCHGRSFESYQFPDHNPGERKTRNLQNDFIACPSFRHHLPEISGIGDSSRERVTPFCKTLRYPNDVQVDKYKTVHSGKSSIPEGPNDDFSLLLTYKRRKAQEKA